MVSDTFILDGRSFQHIVAMICCLGIVTAAGRVSFTAFVRALTDLVHLSPDSGSLSC